MKRLYACFKLSILSQASLSTALLLSAGKVHHPFLEASAMEWLRYSRLCPVVVLERGLRNSRPDVLALTPKGFLTEIEVKRSLADFRRDAAKPHRLAPERCHRDVRLLYYLVPGNLTEKIRPLLPPACGLLTLHPTLTGWTGLPEIRVVVPAPVRRWAKPLSEKRRWELVRDMAGTLVSVESRFRSLRHSLSQPKPTTTKPPDSLP